MRIIPPSDFRTVPWKNGGGITHEIARQDDGDRIVWRLSIAEVASDGPFSLFEGLSRILTVIDGTGLDLATPGGSLVALPFRPLPFSGSLAVSSTMLDGPVRDFNVIFDATRVTASVTPLQGPQSRPLSAPPGGQVAVLCLNGAATVDGAHVPEGALAIGQGARLELAPGARALVAALDPA